MKIAVIVGTRPEIIKLQPIIRKIQGRRKHRLILIHTGQHYDFEMSKIFFDEFHLSEPKYFLNAKAASQGAQTGKIIAKCEEILKIEKPDALLVEGDTNSGLGAAIASSKLGVPIGHVEAGCRSFDRSMPEEINRVVISDLASFHFAPTPTCVNNLLKEGICDSQIFLTGHPIVDLISRMKGKIELTGTFKNAKNNLLSRMGVSNNDFALVTIHRRENISDKKRMSNILGALSQLAKMTPIIFPCHPHTRLSILKFSLKDKLRNVRLTPPVGYFNALSLITHARFVLTDSGGIQQEAALLSTPCITLRGVTEWVETVNAGINFLSDNDAEQILKVVRHVESNYDRISNRFKSLRNLFGEAGVSDRIISIIEKG